MTKEEKVALKRALDALNRLPDAMKQATEAATAMHNIKGLLAEHGVKVPR